MSWPFGSHDEQAQATVEAALMLPMMIVLAFIVANLAAFVEASAAFDEIARDAIVSQGVAQAGEQDAEAAERAVCRVIEDALAREETCSVEVTSEGVGSTGTVAAFTLAPQLRRYTCVLHFRPWPSAFVIASIPFRPPALLHHSCSLVVDPYRSGVVG